MPQHAQRRAPSRRWLILPGGSASRYWDAFERRTRWFRDRLRNRWRWQMTVVVFLLLSAVVTMLSLR